jgi:hypothetical protein
LTVFTMQGVKVSDYKLDCGPPSDIALQPDGGKILPAGSRQVVWVEPPD